MATCALNSRLSSLQCMYELFRRVLQQDTSLSQCLSPTGDINGYITLQWTSIQSRRNRNTPTHFMQQNLKIHASLIGYFACTLRLFTFDFEHLKIQLNDPGNHSTIQILNIGYSQLPPTAKHRFVVWTVLNDFISVRWAVVRSWEELPNVWFTIAKKHICQLSFEFSSLHVIERCSDINLIGGA